MEEEFVLLLESVSRLIEKVEKDDAIKTAKTKDSDANFLYKDRLEKIDSSVLKLIEIKDRFNTDLEEINDKINNLSSLRSDYSALQKRLNEFIQEKINNNAEPSVNDLIISHVQDILEEKLSQERLDLAKLIKTQFEYYINGISAKTSELKDEVENFTLNKVEEYTQRAGQEQKKWIEELIKETIQSLVDSFVPEKGEDGKDGIDGKDAVLDQEFIQEQITKKVLSESKKKYSSIEKSLRSKLQDELEKKIVRIAEDLKSQIPEAVNGTDGKDADNESIKTSIKKEIDTYLSELHNSLFVEMQNKLTQIQSDIRHGEDGADGENGKDADEELIKNTCLQFLDNRIKQVERSLKSILSTHVTDLVLGIKPIQGKKGEKGDRGEEGQRGIDGKKGNSVKSAKIDDSGHLIIQTDERKIDAGKVAINNFYGGGGGDSGGGSDFKYTNELPMQFDVGGYQKGTQFVEVDQRVLWTKLLYGLDLPEFTEFTVMAFPQMVEVGYSWLNFTNTVLFNIANPTLLKENSIVIRQNGIDLLSGLGNISPVAVDIEAYTQEQAGIINFEILAYDTTGVSFNRYYPINFLYRVYYGEFEDDLLTQPGINPINLLRESKLVNSLLGVYDVQDGGYFWICYPVILESNYKFIEPTSDVGIVFDDIQTIFIENEYGLVIEYNCYRTLYKTKGDFEIEVEYGQ